MTNFNLSICVPIFVIPFLLTLPVWAQDRGRCSQAVSE
ncbi:hypothetical protein yinte0001_3610 [Yersinia intermedia ATCC 29909]|nr:hypothetical protein yinte0001_3610 [Yersinia intermedia ATCC 29909]